MTETTTGIVTNGVIIPISPLPEGASVEIRLSAISLTDLPASAVRVSPSELRKLLREQRQAVLATAAALAEDDYRNDKELTGFNAFSEEPDDHSH